MGGEFLEGEFFGGLFCWKKQDQKIRPKNSGPEFGRPKFVSQNSALNSGSGGAKSPVQKFILEIFLGIEGRKSAKHFAKFSPQFSTKSAKISQKLRSRGFSA